MPNKKKKVGLSQREKDAYMLYVSVLDARPKCRGVYTDVYKEVASIMGFEHYRSAGRCVENAIKAKYDPTLLEIQEFYNKHYRAENHVGKYVDKRKQRKTI